MVKAKSALWSCTVIMPLLGLGAWYGASSGCWLGWCDANAAGLAVSLAGPPKVTSNCCPDGPCCPECCTPSCCEEVKVVAVKDKLSTAGDCCSDGSCCTTSATKAVAAFVCPLTGQDLPCPNCCPLNGSR
jgi:hypothetical protein